jgi:hypothetical protein
MHNNSSSTTTGGEKGLMAKVQVSTTLSEAFWKEIMEFGSLTKYVNENDRLKAAANFGVLAARKLDEYEAKKFHLEEAFLKAKLALDSLVNSQDATVKEDAIREAQRQVKSLSNELLITGDECFRFLLAMLTRVRNGGLAWES